MLSSRVINEARDEITRLTENFIDRLARRRSLFVAFRASPDQERLKSYLDTLASRVSDRGLDKNFARDVFGEIATFCGQISDLSGSPVAIEAIDTEIADILVERIRWSVILTRDKWESDKPIRDPDREVVIINKAIEVAATFGIPKSFIMPLMQKIIDNSCYVQGREWTIMAAPYPHRILSGVRPTGPLHLGHYTGAVRDWLKYQEDYDCYYLIADYQALADHSREVESIRRSVLEVALGWLSMGLDPERGSFVIQSYIPEHAELTMLLSMLTTWTELVKNPTVKMELKKLKKLKKPPTVGFITYPMSQVADILLPKADLVPAGKDQAPHINFTREVARTFNHIYSEVFPLPRFKEGEGGTLRGIDREKMGKTANNAIFLADDSETVRRKVRSIITDERRIHGNEPGRPSRNPAFDILDAFDSNKDEVRDMKKRYRKGTISDRAIKDRLIEVLEEFLTPIRERRAFFLERPRMVQDALMSGTERERKIAQETMAQVREAMRITKYGQ